MGIRWRCGGNAERHVSRWKISGGAWQPGEISCYVSQVWGGDSIPVQPDTRYCFKVQAYNSDHEAWTPEVCETSDIMAEMSRGTYRIPYESGTTVEVTGDHVTHEPPTRVDMKGVDGDEPYRIVAAADGVIRFIEDRFSENRPDENPCRNNYVWIEHPNGEWTKYTHMTQRSVTGAAGLAEGNRVRAGTFLGYEDEVGCASRKHLHFEVGVPADPADPIDGDGFLHGGSDENRIPRICGITGEVLIDGARHRAGVCVPGERSPPEHRPSRKIP